ncbi:hypothetical protein [Flagellimonas meridianipacifica]|uniref:Protease stability complex PrcB-like protein n=1 Tax=Flagellimonas meridianipacifica TaxID=1080225 RepID=A0A2T0MCT9_9FLAO|nr:hypothetical protein [Allomuricauda pacifica]PRX55311.1 hypothetical protein CLV81_3720 [Allomuricauda pacifica]
MRVLIFIAYFIVSLTQTSCKSQKQGIVEEESQNDPRITLVDSDDYSGFYEAETMVIRDMKSLSKFYSQVNKTRKPGLPVPTIDFTKHTVLAICAGEQKPNSKMVLFYGKEEGNRLKINMKVKKSNALNEPEITVISYPFYIYTIPFTDKLIDFQYSE